MLLTTLRYFEWVYKNRLERVHFISNFLRDIWKTWRLKSIPPTNFLQAWKTRKLGDTVDNFTIDFKRKKVRHQERNQVIVKTNGKKMVQGGR